MAGEVGGGTLAGALASLGFIGLGVSLRMRARRQASYAAHRARTEHQDDAEALARPLDERGGEA
jgi:hypothetical protein